MSESSLFLNHMSDRREEFKPNPRLNELISELKVLLEPLQHQVNQRYSVPRRPVSLIIGNPRSGTTLLSQVLAATQSFAYPSNLINRFAYAPYLGARIQQLLFDPDFDYRAELADVQSSVNYASTLGRSQGALAISEFFYFWRRFLPIFDPEYMTESQLDQVQYDSLRAELASIEDAFDKPFMGKGMMLQYNVADFAARMPELVFVYLCRPPIYLMQSIYEARQKFYGTPNIWWSVKPREFERLSSMDPTSQVAGQVYFTQRAIERGLAQLEPARVCRVEYDCLCEHPAAVYDQLRECYVQLGSELPATYRGEPTFPLSRQRRLPPPILDEMEAAYARFQEQDEIPNA